MNREKKITLVPRLRFSEFMSNAAIDFINGDKIFSLINNRNSYSNLPVLAITQEFGAIPRDQIDYNVSVSDKSLESYKVVEIGDFIISLRTFQGGIEYSLYHGICSPAYIILRKKINIVEQYYKYYFKTSKFIQDLNKDLEGIRDGKMVSYSQFSAILLPVPEIKEQQKIADCISSLNELIAVENKKLGALKAHKKGLLQKLFPAEGKTVPEVRFPGFTDAWEQRKWSDTVDVSTNMVDPRSGKFDDLPHIGPGNIESFSGRLFDNVNTVKEDGLISGKFHFNKGDVIYGKINPPLGKYVFAPFAGLASADTYVLNAKNGLAQKFLFTLLQTTHFFKYSVSVSMRLGMPKINRDELNEYEYSAPHLIEQECIGEFFISLDRLITLHQRKLEFLRVHKDGLMQGLFPSVQEVFE